MSNMRKALLVGAAIMTVPLATSMSAAADAPRVGIASAVAGDPTGKPPDEIERVLHVGLDVQAGEVITTGSADRAHLLFLDGTALTIGSEAQVTLDRFVYDSDRKLGELGVTATKGVFRLVGGKISKKTPVIVTTPSGTITIRGGIALFSVEPTRTTATFVFGYEMTLTSQGRTRRVTAPGFQVSAMLGQPPGLASPVARRGLADSIGRLEANGGKRDGGADRAAKAAGLAEANSARGPNAAGPVQGGPAPASQMPGGPNGPGGPPRMGGFDPQGAGPMQPFPPAGAGVARTAP
ncbi:FecR family protein [Reyranella aquatilis]|nr:FecR domain-containing protein [Reyranella aquatilis]